VDRSSCRAWTRPTNGARCSIRPPRAAGVTLATRGEGYGPSDHTSFYLKDVPVLHFFTNTHSDYHKPSDDWEKIDGPGLEKVAAIVTDVVSAAGEPSGEAHPATRRRSASATARHAEHGQLQRLSRQRSGFHARRARRQVERRDSGSPADQAGLRAAMSSLASARSKWQTSRR
jgi:hypothetical protein